MALDLDDWMKDYEAAVDAAFGDRVWFLGLQGSRARVEAAEDSDVDTVLVLDRLTPEDIDAYRTLLDGLPHRGLACGFLSGRDELLAWDAADLVQFVHDTTAIRGSLAELLPRLDGQAVARAVTSGAGNVYHGAVHTLVHSRSPEMIAGLAKGAAFVVQARHLQRTGTHVRRQSDLVEVVDAADRDVLTLALAAKGGAEVDVDRDGRLLFAWAQEVLAG